MEKYISQNIQGKCFYLLQFNFWTNISTIYFRDAVMKRDYNFFWPCPNNSSPPAPNQLKKSIKTISAGGPPTWIMSKGSVIFLWRSPLYVGCSFCQTTLLFERILFIVDYRLKNNLAESTDFVTAKNRRQTHRLTYKGGPILNLSWLPRGLYSGIGVGRDMGSWSVAGNTLLRYVMSLFVAN